MMSIMTVLLFNGFSAFVMYQIAGKFLSPRPGLLAAALRLTACCVATGNIIYIGDPVNILYLLPFFLAVFGLFYKNAPMARISVAMLLFSLAMAMNALIDSSFAGDIEKIYFRAFLRIAVWLLIWLLVRKAAGERFYELTEPLWRLVAMLTLMPFGATIASVTLASERVGSAAGNHVSTAVLIFAFFSALVLLYALVVLSRHARLEQENRLYEMRELYYEGLAQEQLLVRRLRHDMANHLAVIAGLLADGQRTRAETYIRGLEEAPGMLSGVRYCANEVVNAVLASKCPILERDEVRVSIEVAVPEELPFSDADLCAILGNAVDNAIEASRRLERTERCVSVRIKMDAGLFLLRVSNASPHVQEDGNGSYFSGKHDRRAHGHGLDNIRAAVEKYGGVCEASWVNGVFQLLVSIPYK